MSMGIYIEGMEMPKGCGACPASIYGACDVGQRHLGEYRWSADMRPKWCPMTEVPSHGRLVDGDVLEAKMKERRSYVGRLSDPLCLIEDAPTVIPAEEGE